MLSREVVRQLAVQNSFSFKVESEGEADLKPYVYEFCAAVFRKVETDGIDSIDRLYIRQQAETSGFKAKEQKKWRPAKAAYSGALGIEEYTEVDINDYVYLFAFAIATASKQQLCGMAEEELAQPNLSGIPFGWKQYNEELLACFAPQGLNYAKEKFGELRASGVQITDTQASRLAALKAICSETCMHCGTTDNVTFNRKGWIGPVCQSCLVK